MNLKAALEGETSDLSDLDETAVAGAEKSAGTRPAPQTPARAPAQAPKARSASANTQELSKVNTRTILGPAR